MDDALFKKIKKKVKAIKKAQKRDQETIFCNTEDIDEIRLFLEQTNSRIDSLEKLVERLASLVEGGDAIIQEAKNAPIKIKFITD